MGSTLKRDRLPDKPLWLLLCLTPIAGGTAFLTTVLMLQYCQTGYDATSQLMSELALGAGGDWMFIAFAAIAAASFAISVALWYIGSEAPLWLMLAAASLAFLGAGIFPLGETTTLHVTLVATAFVLVVLSMYLASRLVPVGVRFPTRWINWIFAFFTAVLSH